MGVIHRYFRNRAYLIYVSCRWDVTVQVSVSLRFAADCCHGVGNGYQNPIEDFTAASVPLPPFR